MIDFAILMLAAVGGAVIAFTIASCLVTLWFGYGPEDDE